ncbi:uncharacterized protein [Amphiura filiformis]|uniref:uncharacterized protein n=1 Tax=Amphiura filiformis TaxID=82378 RepID=UPI003B226838
MHTSREHFEAAEYLDQVSELIGPEGGTLGFDDNIAQLIIPPGALEKPTQIVLSIVSPETEHPPLGDKFIIAPIVRLEPDGLQFLRHVTLTVKHAAVDLAPKDLEVWTKTAGRNANWLLHFDGKKGTIPDALLTKDVAKIRFTHFSLWCWLGLGKLRVHILPFVPVDLQRSKSIGLTVYAVKSSDVKFVQEDMTKANNVLCLDSVVKVYDIRSNKTLEIDLRDVKDKNNTDAWEVRETPQNIHGESINKGFGNASCRFVLTPKPDKVDSIIATLKVQRKANDPHAMEVYITYITEKSSPQPKDTVQLQGDAGAEATETGTISNPNNRDTTAEMSVVGASASSTISLPYKRSDDHTPSGNPIQVFHLVLDDASDILHDNLNPNNILMRLKSRHALSDNEVAEINNIHGLGERVHMLLAILKTKNVQAYDEFMSALREFDHDLYCEVKKIEKRYPYRM